MLRLGLKLLKGNFNFIKGLLTNFTSNIKQIKANLLILPPVITKKPYVFRWFQGEQKLINLLKFACSKSEIWQQSLFVTFHLITFSKKILPFLNLTCFLSSGKEKSICWLGSVFDTVMPKRNNDYSFGIIHLVRTQNFPKN